MKSSHILFVCMILAGLLLAGCGTQTTPEPVATLEPSATSLPPTPTLTATMIPPPTATVELIPTEVPTATPWPVATLNAEIGVENLNLRAGPSTIYAILGSYSEGTEVTVLARVPGNEWVRVQIPEEETGWMSAQLLNLGESVNALPLEDVTESIVVSGRVIDTQARPVDGVSVAVLQRLVEGTLRTDAVTGVDGYFYAYIPEQSAGIWEAQIVGVECESWIMDENCNLEGHFLYNFRAIFEPPPLSPILFAYQVADAAITGMVSNADGDPVSIRVFAERADGAYAFVQSDDNGRFAIPVSTGEWRVYAMQYTPNQEGEAVTVQIATGTEPETVFIQAPVAEE